MKGRKGKHITNEEREENRVESGKGVGWVCF